MEKFNCIIVDDDEIDRLTTLSYVKKFSELNVVGVFESTADAAVLVKDRKIDILFLDIDMPAESGLEFRKKLMDVPVCIFITAHPEHAVESFEVEALDFIVKPLTLDRFSKTVVRIKEFMDVRHRAALFEKNQESDTVYIKEGHQQIKIKLHSVLYLEGLKDYTLIVTDSKRHCVLASIGNLLKEENFKSFLRVHRSYAVQKASIKKIGTNDIELSNQVLIPIGRKYKSDLATILGQ